MGLMTISVAMSRMMAPNIKEARSPSPLRMPSSLRTNLLMFPESKADFSRSDRVFSRPQADSPGFEAE